MTTAIEAQLILCDAAQAYDGKISMLGAGWSLTTTPTSPHAVAVLMKIPWDRANSRISLVLQLFGADGDPVLIPPVAAVTSPDTPSAGLPIRQEAQIEVGRPAGLAPGSQLDASFALNVGSMPLAPDRYEWRLTVGDTQVQSAFQVMDPRFARRSA